MKAYLVAACIMASSFVSTGILPLQKAMIVATATEDISSQLISLTGTSERMISYRHQRHMWLSSDGAIHTVINQGNNGSNQSLVLYSSFDQGKTWSQMIRISNTGNNSTADGFLFKRKLYLAYSSHDGKVFYQTLTYYPQSKSWSTDQLSLVYESTIGTVASAPTVMMDRNQKLWLAFVGENLSGQTFTRLYASSDAGNSWADTAVNFGAVNNSLRRSAVLVNLLNGIGAVYTHENTVNWAYRQNDWASNAPWQSEQIFNHAPGASDDPYASHFSVVTDKNQNIHIATRDAGRLLYLRFDATKQSWDTPKYLTSDVNVGYMQIALTTTDSILIACNQGNGQNLLILESQDYGKNFTASARLWPDAPELGTLTSVDLSNPRMEMPSIVDTFLPVVQQFTAAGTQRLLYFNVRL